MIHKYQTRLTTAAALRAGQVLYHHGAISSVSFDGATVIVRACGREYTFQARERVRIYPNL